MASQNKNREYGKYLYHVSYERPFEYDTYSDFVGCADSEEEVRRMHPESCKCKEKKERCSWCSFNWIKLKDVDKLEVKFLGKAENIEKGVITASFHAG